MLIFLVLRRARAQTNLKQTLQGIVNLMTLINRKMTLHHHGLSII